MKQGKLAFILSCLVGISAYGQNAIQFTGIKPTIEHAMTLSWQSNSNEVYEIDYADSLIDTNTGTITWNTLYTDYPSHGTNTFIADAGNYDTTPEIPHPNLSPIRFYRVMMTGTNTSPTNPIVSISSVTNAQSLVGDVVITVSASSSEILSEVQLYIDGEEQWMSDDGTNFLINTCEWPNGLHVIFATAKSQSDLQSSPFVTGVTYGRSVSPYVNVTFDNLITRFDLSEPFFEPSEGQTQKVTAAFAANVDWTLEIQDINSNDVNYVTGSGTSMEFDWDGTGTNGIEIPDGRYTYLLTAQTNNQSFAQMQSLSFSEQFANLDDQMQLWVQPSGDPNSVPTPLAIFPSGIDTNSLDIFEASVADVALYNELLFPEDEFSEITANAGAGAAAPASQNSRIPKRKPRVGVKNKSGTFGILYKTYPGGTSYQEPRTGRIPPLQPVYVAVDQFSSQTQPLPWGDLPSTKPEAKGLAQGLKIGAYKQKFLLADAQWSGTDIRKTGQGGHSIFNTCNFGYLSTHGCYGTIPEIDGIKYTYIFLWDSAHGPEYVRLSDMDFGSTGANGLKWMTINACDMLHPANVTSMQNNFKMPDNGDLHLLLGATTPTYSAPLFGITYASNLVFQVSIKNSFVNAGQQVYAEMASNPKMRVQMTNAITFRVRGTTPCMTDTLYQSSDPDPDFFQSVDTTVFTPSP